MRGTQAGEAPLGHSGMDRVHQRARGGQQQHGQGEQLGILVVHESMVAYGLTE